MIGIAYAAAAEHASSGLPQFQTSTFSSQSFWALVSFGVLLYLLYKHVLPGITDVLDARTRQIEGDIKGAETARQEAEAALAEYKRQLATAREVAAKTLEEARTEAARHQERSRAELDEELNKKKASALEEIEAAKRRAMEEVRQSITDVAMQAAEKLIGRSVSAADASAMVDEAIQRLGQGPGKPH